ncbi:MAG: ribosomal-protein-alanine N-acetyltransferase [Yoonia sp.]|jgi:ribosomal-protein-alanine N-acetyltransferase
MTPADLAQTHAAAFTQTRPWSESEFTDLLKQRGMILCGDAQSFLLGRIIGDEAEVLTVATHPNHQRRGYARALLMQFIAQARTQDVASIFLEVSEINDAAKPLYYNQGFRKAGHRPRYYDTTDGGKIGADILRLEF